MKFAVFTTSTPEWSYEEAAANLAAQGWDGIEWGVKDFPKADIPSFRAGNRAVWPFTGLAGNLDRMAQITKSSGLQYAGIASYVMAHERDDVETVLAATAKLGAGQVRIVAPHVRSGNYRELMEQARRDYAWVAERAAHHGVKALVEIHHRLISASSSSALRLVDGLDPRHIGVLHDLGNTVIEGQEDYLGSFEMLGEYLAHVHIKNAIWTASAEPDEEGGTVFTYGWATLRKGQASVRAYFEALRKIGYEGWVTLEDFTTELPLAERLADNLAYLKSVHARVAALPEASLCDDPTDPMLASTLRPPVERIAAAS